MPKSRKVNTRINGRGILRTQKMVFFINTRSALLAATKTESVNNETAQITLNNTKAMKITGLSLMGRRAGDHKAKPAKKMIATKRDNIPTSVKQVFIMPEFFSALGRKRISVLFIPNMLNRVSKLIADITAEPRPTSVGV
jgi:hypothetical protein